MLIDKTYEGLKHTNTGYELTGDVTSEDTIEILLDKPLIVNGSMKAEQDIIARPSLRVKGSVYAGCSITLEKGLTAYCIEAKALSGACCSIFSETDIIIDGVVMLGGPITANGNITLKDHVFVNSVIAGGNVDVEGHLNTVNAISIGGNLNVVESLVCGGALLCDGNVSAHGGIRVTGVLSAKGNIISMDGPISVTGSLFTWQDLFAQGINIGCSLQVGGRIHSDKGISSGFGINAGTAIEARDGIVAGYDIIAGTYIDCGKRIFAGTSVYSTTQNSVSVEKVCCAELRRGDIAHGRLLISEAKAAS